MSLFLALAAMVLPARAQTIQWTSQFGSVEPSFPARYAVGGEGNIYVAGTVNGAVYGEKDGFVRKYDSNGNVLWSQNSSGVFAHGISVDSYGVYVAGGTSGGDAFARRYDSEGNVLWTSQFGGISEAQSVSTDPTGIYVVGFTETVADSENAFVRKYDFNGNALWTKQFGTNASDIAFGVSADSTGIYVGGYTEGSFNGNAFVRKYDTNGNELWTKEFGALGVLSVWANSNGIYLAGPTSGAIGFDAFVRKYDSNGNELWTKQFGTSDNDVASGVWADSTFVYVAGKTCGTFPGQTSAGLGNCSAFLTKIRENIAPAVTITGPPSGTIYPVNTPVNFTGSFTDPNTTDTHSAQWMFDAITAPGTVAESNGSGTVSKSYSFTTPGVYQVTLRVTDNAGAFGTAETVGGPGGQTAQVIVYDPNGGFVTGGGWINSPAGAYTADPTLSGKATFAFFSKYKQGQSAPIGETEFQFKVGNLNFASSTYDWLVVAGARAQFKGKGKINGIWGYTFLLTAVDGQVNGGGGVDKFRIKIWNTTTNTVIYDNVLGASDDIDSANPQQLGGGAIVIQK